MFDGVNLYRYCRNNPINLFDQKGTEVISIILFSAVLVGVLYYESCIDHMKGINQVEKKYVTNHPVESIIANNLQLVASNLTNAYWGEKATAADTTYANAFKHAVWCALMTRDLGWQEAWAISTNHEYWDYGKTQEYLGTTLSIASEMDLWNNRRGIEVGTHIPFWYSNEQVADFIIEDMRINPEQYWALNVDSFNSPLNGW